ncbi:glycoside hydrolase family 19 protein [Chishuiella sp.]|uniref:glycoside hydrolase family 19 protein n=1 Tax=Chishuiella sp. TaxID=1969467 RepID=UPI0028A66555|nr:glycoside hydrolase family 19 protein [Chishuiella sp.]
MLTDFQKKYGLVADGVFGKNTARKIKEVFNIKYPALFFGQVCHESANLTLKEENLNYTASRLQEVFPKYFQTFSKAKEYERNPQKLANLVYNNRMGNLNPNDGYYFRGRGAIQLTGRDNYKAFENWLVIKELCKPNDIMNNPELVWKEFYIESAIFFFDKNNLWNITDVKALTKRVNGGLNGLKERKEKTLLYAKWF